ncbi:MAG: proteasome assembly chaperone family protein [Thermoprotei archaeon]|nr:MAG: proteasome assembly chaperone family protein [Thermoprotei archaeon]
MEIEIVKIKPLPKNSTMIIGLPDIGLVGAISSSFLIKAFNMKEAAFLDSPNFPPILVFHDTKPKAPVRLHANSDKIVLISEIPILPGQFTPLAKKILSLTEELEARNIIMIGGIPAPNRIEIKKPKVYGAAILEKDKEKLKQAGIELFKNGFIAGIYASILKECIKKKCSAIILLAESYANYPDPGAAAAALEALGKLLGITINVDPLLQQEEEIRLKLRELMQRTVNSLKASSKEYEYAVPLMYA